MTRLIFMLFLGLLLVPRAGHAQQPRQVALRDALEQARHQHVDLAVVRARVQAARLDAEVPQKRWQPTVGASAQFLAGTTNNTTASYLGSPLVDIPRIGSTRSVAGLGSLTPEPTTLATVGARQMLYDGGLVAAEQAVADAQLRAETQTARSAWLDVSLRVEEAWFAVRAAHQVLLAAEQARTRALAHRDLVAALVKQKLRPMADQTREEAQLQRSEVDVLQAQAGLAVTRALLAASMGVVEAEIDAAEVSEPLPPSPSLEEAAQRAIRQSPRLQAAAARLAAQEAQTRVHEAEARPELHASAGVSMRAGGAQPSSGQPAELGGWLPEVPNWFAGVVLNWPLYDAHKSAQTRTSQAHAQILAREIEAMREARRVTVQRAWATVQFALQTLPALQKAQEAARLNDAQAQALLQRGLNSGVEVTDAATRLAEADIAVATGQFQAARARAQLARAMAEDWYGAEASEP